MPEFDVRLANLFPTEGEVPEPFRLPVPLDQREFLVGGSLVPWEGPLQDVISPICRRDGDEIRPVRIGGYPLLTARESMAALDAADRAWDHGRGKWPTLSVADRIACVRAFVQAMKLRRAEVVNLLMWEIGKSLDDSEKEFDRTVEYILATLEALKDLDRTSSRFSIEQGIVGQIRRAPLGITLCMGPFNYPLNETFTTMIPALVMGNPVIFKAPRLGVLLHRPMLEAFRDAFPPGVVNTVSGDGAEVIGPLVQSGRIGVLAFIGSSRVADLIRQQHPAPHRLRCALGLGAKNAAIVLPDADLDTTVRETLLGSLSFNGQRCTALKILFVHRNLMGSFLEAFGAGVSALPEGMPWQRKVAITPLPEAERVDAMRAYVSDATGLGARLVNADGGSWAGTLFRPAVVAQVTPAMRLYHEEQFGPVVPVVPFDDLATPIDYVVGSCFGQQCSLFGSDPERLARLIDPLVNQVCRVNLNCQCQRGPDTFPFTGRKDSAEGTLSVTDALRVFSIRTLVAAKQGDANHRILNAIVHDRRSNFLSTDFLL